MCIRDSVLAALAVLTHQELLFILIGGVFLIETLSVIIQVVSFTTRGKRVFKMAPIHHHFEMLEMCIRDRCDGEMIDGYAADMTIADLSLHEGSHLVLWYDFGDDYFFDIHVMDVDEHNDIQSLDDLKVLAGEGYGIWEDEHQLLELYYENQEEFLRVVSEMGLNEDEDVYKRQILY